MADYDVIEAVKDIAGGVGGELKNIAKTAVSQVKGSVSAPTAVPQGASSTGELGKIGQSITGQILGPAQVSLQELSGLQNKDREFSQQAQAQVVSRINAIYGQYAQKKKRELAIAEQQQAQAQEQKKELVEKKQEQEQNVAIAKTRAEIKNYGAE